MRVLRSVPFAIALIVLASLAFLPGLDGPFLLDDLSSIPKARPGGLSAEEAVDIAARNRAGLLRRPVAALTFTANHLIARDAPLSFKVTNLVLHALTGLLVLWLARIVLGWLAPHWSAARRNGAALVAALIFVAHPLQVSTVLYVVQRMALLATSFTLAALIVLARFLERADAADRRRFALATLAYWLWFALAVGSKESGVLLPLLALVLYASARRAGFDARPSRWFAAHAIALPLAGAIAVLPFAWHAAFAGYAERDWGLFERLATESTVLWFYLRLWLVPQVSRMGLYHDDYPVYGMTDPAVWLAAAAWLALIALAWKLRRRVPLLAFAVAWYLAAHALESTVLPLELVFEHRNYLALIGPAIAVGAALSRIFATETRLLRATPFVLVGLLAVATLHRSATWSSDQRFHFHEIANHGGSPRAQLRAASEAVARGDLAAGRRHIEQLKARVPAHAWPWLLDAHIQCSRPDHPVEWDRIEAVLDRPHVIEQDVGALIALAKRFLPPRSCAQLDVARFEHALGVALEAARREQMPRRVATYRVLLSQVARGTGRLDAAVALLRAAAADDPPGIEALSDLAYLELNAGRLDDAAATIAALRRIAVRDRLPIGYRIDDLERQWRAAEAQPEKPTDADRSEPDAE